MNRIEFRPRALNECAECGEVITDGWAFRLNEHEVVCLADYVEACLMLWALGGYDQRAEA